MRKTELKSKRDLTSEIVGRLARRHSTAVVLFHHAVALRLGLGPTDHKCLDLLRERGSITGSELAAITGLTTGAITGVIARLEQAGYVGRQADPYDRRKQILSPALARSPIQDVIHPLRKDMAALLQDFDARQLSAIAEFLSSSAELIHRHTALLRAETIYDTNSDLREIQNQPPFKRDEMKVRV